MLQSVTCQNTNALCQTKLPLISLINWLLTKQCLFVLGIISRNCTTEGWSDVYPSVHSVCFEPSLNPNKVSDWIYAVRSFPELLYSHLSWKQMPSERDFWLYTVFRIIALTILKELCMNGSGKGRYFAWKALLFPLHMCYNHCVWTLRTFRDPEPFSACIPASWDYLWGRDRVCVHLEMRVRTLMHVCVHACVWQRQTVVESTRVLKESEQLALVYFHRLSTKLLSVLYFLSGSQIWRQMILDAFEVEKSARKPKK